MEKPKARNMSPQRDTRLPAQPEGPFEQLNCVTAVYSQSVARMDPSNMRLALGPSDLWV